MGLIQRVVEREGVATVGISTLMRYTEAVQAPRSIFLRWPMGHALGEPGFAPQQEVVLKNALDLAINAHEPGTIKKLPYRWRRYEDMGISKK